jgi:hypothetical protein
LAHHVPFSDSLILQRLIAPSGFPILIICYDVRRFLALSAIAISDTLQVFEIWPKCWPLSLFMLLSHPLDFARIRFPISGLENVRWLCPYPAIFIAPA